MTSKSRPAVPDRVRSAGVPAALIAGGFSLWQTNRTLATMFIAFGILTWLVVQYI
ncbi:hypothetical protein [Haladaptatus sp. DFWS20]|uniref:hypothetical protein n=1 Tax=Haladaptatus sp. DFWS20 TaxID=3403467 RepID=UPI003EBA1C43